MAVTYCHFSRLDSFFEFVVEYSEKVVNSDSPWAHY